MKKLAKVIVLLLVIAFIGAGFAFAGGKQEKPAEESGKTEETSKPEPAKAEPILIAMATDVGGLGDKSFNDGSWAGLKKAEAEFDNVEARVIESKEMTDYVPNLTGLADDGAKVVFAVGFLMADAMVEAASMYPDVAFAGIDIFVDPASAPSNARGILFKEQESGYLAGVFAGMMTKEYASASDMLNDDNVVGMVLGMDIPPVERYQAGFYAGVKSVNPDCKVLSVVTGSFTDQAKGNESAMAMIQQGADIIFQIAGLTGVGAINACKEAGVAAIGVDVDQNAVAPGVVLTSAEKRLTEAAYLTCKDVLEGTFKGGVATLGINEGATGISAFHQHDSMIPKAVKDAVMQAEKDMKAGKIAVPASRAEAGYEG